MINTLQERIEELAAKLVLGGTDGLEWGLLLTAFRRDAAESGREDIAKIAEESLDALPRTTDPKAQEALFSVAIARIQQVLSSGGARQSGATTVPASLGEDPEMIADVIMESREHLTQVEIQMMTLEKEPEDSEAINTVFRAFHTIKGLAGFMGLDDIRDVAHETETLLDLARNHKLRINPHVVDIVLAAGDFLKIWCTRLEVALGGGDVGDAPEKQMLLERIRQGATPPVAPEATALTQLPPKVQRAQAVKSGSGTVEAPPDRNPAPPPAERRVTERRAEGSSQAMETRSVKVDTTKLDYLVDMAGEMVIAQSMVRHHPELAALRTPALLRSLAQLARITGELQKTAMSMRMVPVGGVFQKMSRLVRDLARKTGKQAEMVAVGGDTELDRNLVEELADPLMHMVRNAADHGIEPSDERLAAGKDPVGKIRLSASHQAGYILIEIADDGRGLVREKILEKARRTGLVEDGSHLSDSEVFNFIFHPGFSTAAQVTDVSGRGVGMDVVKKQIQKLRGRVEIESTPGKGTSFFLRLPLTLAMIDGLVVGVGTERYILPIFSVREMLRPTTDMIFTVEDRQEMAMVRNSLLPIVRLHRRFAVTPRSEDPAESLLIVAEAEGNTFCLMVDELVGKQEVVIKSLGEMLKDIPGVAGGAILGDGRVGLILDLEGLFRAGAK